MTMFFCANPLIAPNTPTHYTVAIHRTYSALCVVFHDDPGKSFRELLDALNTDLKLPRANRTDLHAVLSLLNLRTCNDEVQISHAITNDWMFLCSERKVLPAEFAALTEKKVLRDNPRVKEHFLAPTSSKNYEKYLTMVRHKYVRQFKYFSHNSGSGNPLYVVRNIVLSQPGLNASQHRIQVDKRLQQTGLKPLKAYPNTPDHVPPTHWNANDWTVQTMRHPISMVLFRQILQVQHALVDVGYILNVPYTQSYTTNDRPEDNVAHMLTRLIASTSNAREREILQHLHSVTLNLPTPLS